MRIAVCDDDETAVSFLRELIESYPKQKLSADGYSSGEDLLRTRNIYDLIFLDIDMKGIDGIETARRIRIHDRKVKIVYVTSYKEYAGKAFSVHAFGYLLKPVKQEKIWKQIEDALLWQEEEAPEVKQVEFTAVEGLVRLPVDMIYYFEYQNRRIYMKAKDTTYEMRGKISDIACRMEEYGFSVPHKSFVVNLYHVKNIKGYEILMMNGEWIPLSQKQAVQFKEKLSLYLADKMG
ncbi:Transcriptional regulatory protein YpdB [Blautia producta]|uniref:Stage 0 sporulation protein A homolog n=1 Tax=Blautia producta TaxID=33035 RepID=A0A4P6M3F2_9FIRM|nr:LytTR family DNA-binding domain-containing protein [Blautia producta]QBE99016.1 Transcriptional regulatory protein YpdB [Blautia producta]